MADDVEVDITGDSGPLVEALQAAADAAEELAAIIRQLRDDLEETDGASQAAAEGLDQISEAAASVTGSVGSAVGMLEDLDAVQEETAASAQDLAESEAEAAAGIEAEGAAAAETTAEMIALNKQRDQFRKDVPKGQMADVFAAEQKAVQSARTAMQDDMASWLQDTEDNLDEAKRLADEEGAINPLIMKGDQQRGGSMFHALNSMLSELGAADPGQTFGITRLSATEFSKPEEMAYESYFSTIEADAKKAGTSITRALAPTYLFAQSQKDIQRNLLSSGSALTQYESALASWRSDLEEVAPELEEVTAGAAKFTGAFDGMSEASQAATDAGQALTSAWERYTAAQAASLAAQEAYVAAMAEGGAESEATAEAMDHLRDATAEEAAATAGLVIAWDALSGSLAESDAALAVANHELKAMRDDEAEAAAGALFLGGALSGMMSILDIEGLFSKLQGLFSGGLGSGLSSVFMGAANGIQSLLGFINPMVVGIGALVAIGASLIPVVFALASGFISFAALAAPALYKVVKGFSAVSQAQATYRQAEKAAQLDPTKANLATARRDLLQLRAAYANLPPPVRQAVRALQGFESAWSAAGKKAGIQHDALKDLTRGIHDATDAIPAMTRTARAFAPVMKDLLFNIGNNLKSGPFRKFTSDIVKEMPLAASAIHKAASAFGEFFSQIMKPATASAGSNVLKQMSGFFKQINPNIVNGLTGAMRVVASTFKEMNALSKSGLGKGIGRAWDDFWQGAKNIGNWSRDFGRSAGDALKSLGAFVGIGGKSITSPWKNFETQKPTAKTFGIDQAEIGALKGQASKSGQEIGQATSTGVTKGMSQGGKAAAKSTSQLADEAVKGIQGIKGKLSSAVSQSMSQDISQGMSQAKGAISSTIGRTIQSALTDARSQATSGWTQIETAFTQGAQRCAQAVQPMVGRIEAAVAPLPGRMQAIGSQIGAGLAAGIEASTGAAVATAAAMAAAVTKAAQVHLGVHSPSTVFAKIGRNTIQGFIDGLLGGRAAVTAAMNLIFGAHAHNNTIQKWINKMRQEVRAAFSAGVIGSQQDSWFTRLIREDNKRLQKLARERKTIENEIKAADALAKSVQSGAETGANVVSSFGMTFAGLNQTSKSYPTIQKAMKANLASIRQFRSDIAKLKKEGLSKQIIKQLLGAGVSGGLPIAEQLLKGGNVREIDKLQGEIDKASRKLGITGANAAYESGREIGKGLAAGLKSQLRVIEDAMRRIARELVRAIRQALRIKSPSQVMKEVGMLTGLGLAQGMDAAGGVVRAAAARMGASATSGLMLSARAAPRSAGTGPAQVIQNHITLQVDGKTLARTMQVHSLRHAHRNPATGLKLAGRNI